MAGLVRQQQQPQVGGLRVHLDQRQRPVDVLQPRGLLPPVVADRAQSVQRVTRGEPVPALLRLRQRLPGRDLGPGRYSPVGSRIIAYRARSRAVCETVRPGRANPCDIADLASSSRPVLIDRVGDQPGRIGRTLRVGVTGQQTHPGPLRLLVQPEPEQGRDQVRLQPRPPRIISWQLIKHGAQQLHRQLRRPVDQRRRGLRQPPHDPVIHGHPRQHPRLLTGYRVRRSGLVRVQAGGMSWAATRSGAAPAPASIRAACRCSAARNPAGIPSYSACRISPCLNPSRSPASARTPAPAAASTTRISSPADRPDTTSRSVTENSAPSSAAHRSTPTASSGKPSSRPCDRRRQRHRHPHLPRPPRQLRHTPRHPQPALPHQTVHQLTRVQRIATRTPQDSRQTPSRTTTRQHPGQLRHLPVGQRTQVHHHPAPLTHLPPQPRHARAPVGTIPPAPAAAAPPPAPAGATPASSPHPPTAILRHQNHRRLRAQPVHHRQQPLHPAAPIAPLPIPPAAPTAPSISASATTESADPAHRPPPATAGTPDPPHHRSQPAAGTTSPPPAPPPPGRHPQPPPSPPPERSCSTPSSAPRPTNKSAPYQAVGSVAGRG